ncbi:hypothetical protein [Celeribacter litoreus]|uniref:hypothetical protein n=1 Tax=Celeribacter litoreus TaxID=2876714 RepID=UPI001CCFC6DD|nr:hypothetical protein [Celeribacter litoreus]MCA0045085.1 hypothetical protein [Celeribacter litoreus]
MPSDAIETEQTEDGQELRNRRDRLEALKSRRASGAPSAAAPARPASGGISSMVGQGESAKRQRKLLVKIYKVMTQTPADGRGGVPDTPFTEAGVERLMKMLSTRASDGSQAGAKVAGGVLNFLTPADGEAATASGASIAKLQTIARRIEAFRSKGAGRQL